MSVVRTWLEAVFPALRERRSERALCWLLMPGVKQAIGKCEVASGRRVEDSVHDDADHWLRQWIKSHKHDYKTEFRPALHEFLKRRTGIPVAM